MTQTVFIDGAAGTTGLEIAERLAGRREFSLLAIDDARRKDAGTRREALNDADFVILCLPDDAARDAVAMIANDRTRVIDASTAHRVAPGWVYGFPEVSGHDAVANAARVSNPGCYSTGFIALIAPLIRAGLLPADWPYACNAVSGYSGGGKALIERFEQDRDIAWRGYALGLGHKHVPEMQARCGLSIAPLFSPSVIPAHRGMAVDVQLPLAAMRNAAAPSALRAALADFYAASPIVVMGEAPTDGEMLLRASDAGDDRIELFVFANADGSQARLVAQLDNLGKGASGACVQNLNIMAGLPETEGLRL
ncbi:N-acetyl-gamma-glutamyl-phosphate reductase [Sphingopyxis bauzanensis]|uniref:N-acetyl-gamma-glutamyl-phosphate reductase n=1 Tax=Sphingopyxis bauzanensis TaxID=651663 RepID=A0A246JVZ7_9SPHN|nr:N-acetyl-gamma-glutamyl-phosphate reductase [Sphingopyxis bauzanensis]OWQ97239.1 N-acetyl-gamma-glutamyl-phosphate reductase [Sphingopyxis bauzanensis]GGJ48432.1 N-acetyl-gamma-glutamyl-phosphate reductase [Sphingopyxis bauzanensis]